MGLFDSVYANCPTCGREIEIQSKSGPCELSRYDCDQVPTDVASAIDRRTIECDACGAVSLAVVVPPWPEKVRIVLVKD
jgi:uncharacterized Zn finger protein